MSKEICRQENCTDTPQKQLPTTYEMLKNFIGSAKDIVGGAMAGNEVLVSENQHKHRLDICGGCDYFILESKRCSKCGCFMNAKAMFVETKCPVNKW